MKKIRLKVFETNSSSSHSVSVAEDNKPFVVDELLPNENGVIEIYERDFGWEWFKTNEVATKAAYAYIQTGRSDLVPDIIKKVTGAKDVFFLGKGCVDHDSMGILEYDQYWLTNFIFNKNAWLFGGNDNDYAETDFYDVPYYDVNGQKHEVNYTHKVCSAGKELFKLKEGFTNEDVKILLDYYFDDQCHYLTESEEILQGYENEYIFQEADFNSMTLEFEYSRYAYFKEKRNMSTEILYDQVKEEADALFKANPEKYIKNISFSILKISQ